MSLYYRKYKNYQNYLSHQAEKLNIGLRENVKKFRQSSFDEEVCSFTKRLSVAKKYILNDKILCLGARLGAEVEALRKMGFKNAIGIDINPGPNNPYVIKGDFHKMEFDDESFDVIYSNAIDHSYKISLFSKEIDRVLTFNGNLILEVCHLKRKKERKKVFITAPGKYESVIYDTTKDIKKEMKEFKCIDSFISPYDVFYFLIFKKIK